MTNIAFICFLSTKKIMSLQYTSNYDADEFSTNVLNVL